MLKWNPYKFLFSIIFCQAISILHPETSFLHISANKANHRTSDLVTVAHILCLTMMFTLLLFLLSYLSCCIPFFFGMKFPYRWFIKTRTSFECCCQISYVKEVQRVFFQVSADGLRKDDTTGWLSLAGSVPWVPFSFLTLLIGWNEGNPPVKTAPIITQSFSFERGGMRESRRGNWPNRFTCKMTVSNCMCVCCCFTICCHCVCIILSQLLQMIQVYRVTCPDDFDGCKHIFFLL